MSGFDDNRTDNKARQRVFASYYSRSRGVESYRKRRRVNRITKVAVWIILLLIVGGATVLLGRQLFYSLSTALGTSAPEETSSAKQEEVAITTVQPASISVVCAGDVIANGSVIDSGRQADGDAYNFVHLFANIKDEVEGFDLRVVSQETSLAGSEYGFGETYRLNAPQDLGRAEVAGGFNVILRATDHTLDMGTDGLHNELSWWHVEQPSMPVLGVAEPDPDPIQNPGLSNYVDNVYLFEKDGFKIAIINHSTGIGEEDQGCVAPLTEDQVYRDVQKAKDLGAEMIIACPHWGDENTTEITDEQREFAELYADLGVDVIVGSHPRVLQGVETLSKGDGGKTLCYYSLGCLTSSLDADNMLGGLAEFTLERTDDGGCSVANAVLKPVVTHRASGTDHTTYLLSDYSDELSYSGWDGLTPEHYNQRCLEVLGDDFDTEAEELRIDM